MNILPASEQRLEGIWPRFLLNDSLATRYWDRIYVDFPEYQFAMVDGEELLAEGNCIPVAGQPASWRDAFLNAFESGGEPDRVCALAIMVVPAHRGLGLSSVMLEHMRGLATSFGRLVAPLRPTLKERYPLIPIEEYVSWRREDGAHVDPWIRTHERLGGRVTGTADEAMLIRGSREAWEGWTGISFPGDGDYVVPGALVPVSFRGEHGVYREPCVWMEHVVR